MATSPDDLGPDRRFNPVTALAIVAGVLVLLFLVWFMFLRAEDVEVETVAPAPEPVVTPEPEETVEPPKRNGPVETFEVFAPKDPFDPLISAAAAAAAGTAGTAAGTTDGTAETTTGNGTTTTTTDDGTGTTTTTTTTGNGNGGGDGESVGGHRVRVIDVFARGGSRRAQVQVDGTVYTVDEGERFAQNFQLLSTSGQCATMLFGDDEFTLCEGEEILK